ncbi:MAG: MFS transporter [Acidobacteria bacterium]|nr:MFS transporter [Acidobacteriota bacterium]
MQDKIDYKKIFILGSGFLGITAVWTFYNAYVPILLKGFITSSAMIGLVMTFDNILALTVQPVVGALSDRTSSKTGRRKPFIAAAMPFAFLFFIFIPYRWSIISMVAVIIAMNLAMASFRAPLISLMPDIVPSAGRSKANGIINLMGGVGALIAFFLGAKLFDYSVNISFLVIGSLMFIAVMLVILRIKEPEYPPLIDEQELPRKLVNLSLTALLISAVIGGIVYFGDFAGESLLQICGGKMQLSIIAAVLAMGIIVITLIKPSLPEKSLYMFLAIFFWFFGYNGMETFFTLYGKEKLEITPGSAAMILGAFSVAFIIFAVPAALFAGKFSRKRIIQSGLFVIAVAVLPLFVIHDRLPIYALMIIGGAGWAMININSYPMICDMSPEASLGAITGLYYFFSMFAQTVSPPLIGIVIDKTENYASIFPVAAGCFVIASLLMFKVQGGEVKKDSADL